MYYYLTEMTNQLAQIEN